MVAAGGGGVFVREGESGCEVAGSGGGGGGGGVADEFAGGVCLFDGEGGVVVGEVCGLCGVEEGGLRGFEGADVGGWRWG